MLNENQPILPVSSVPNTCTTTAGYANPYSHQSQMYPSSQSVQPISNSNMNTPLYQNPIFQPSTQAMAYSRGPTKENPLGMNVENK